jgi:acyl-CoA synthetase (AMP-forming)/AMP-acid ligase II
LTTLTEAETFTELVLSRAAALPSKDAYIFLRDDATSSEADHLSYGALDAEAKRIASWLQARDAFGKQVLLLFPSSMAFVKAFVGCLYAGAVAVPAPLPGEQGHHLARVAGIVRDAEVKAVLSDAANAPMISAWLESEGLADVQCLAVDGDPSLGDAAAWTRPEFGPDHLAFLQYTSGSTSLPKGVMVTHRNLLANERAIQNSIGSDSESRVGGWLPFYHDMGLIGHVLHPLSLGATSVLMSPVSFLKRPFRWLQMIDTYTVTVGGGPNFGYDLCVRRITDAQLATLDLSSWVGACNGAEPVRAETLRAFAARFAPAGFRDENFFPCYGMAETTLLVSGTPLGQAPVEWQADAAALEHGQLLAARPDQPTRALVSSGVIKDFDVRVVEPEALTQLPDGSVGEIWIKGQSVAPGYWNRPEVNREIFDAGIAGTEGADASGWLRTGDLGVLTNGQLYVTGRLKEMVIINGRNIYPHDVERAVQGLDPALGAGAGAVFAVDTDREHLVVVQEVRPNASTTDLPTLQSMIQQLVGKEFSVPAGNVLLVRPGTIRRTTSGKIQRTLMRKLFLSGRITALYETLDAEIAALLPGTPESPAEPSLEPVA